MAPLASQVYLLAAGEGRRAGGPKAWRLFEGRSLLERQVEFLSRLFRPEDIAVTVQEGWQERVRKIDPDILWIPEDPKQTALGALQALLLRSPIRDWAFLYHVDMPVWEKGLFEGLYKHIPAARSRGEESIAPSHGGRKGHPVLIAAPLAPGIAALDPSTGRLDHWLRERRQSVVELPYPCIHSNWNHANLRAA